MKEIEELTTINEDNLIKFLDQTNGSEVKNDIETKPVCLNNLGYIQEFLGNDQKALDYYEQALKSKNEMNELVIA